MGMDVSWCIRTHLKQHAATMVPQWCTLSSYSYRAMRGTGLWPMNSALQDRLPTHARFSLSPLGSLSCALHTQLGRCGGLQPQAQQTCLGLGSKASHACQHPPCLCESCWQTKADTTPHHDDVIIS